MRRYQVGTAAAIVLIAAVAIYDSRNVFTALPGTSKGDVGPSWYPFWTATVMGLAGLFIAYRALATPRTAEGPFSGRESVLSVVKLVVPMMFYAFSFEWLGFYIATAAYMGFFASYLGRYTWWKVVAAAILTPLAIYLLFEVGFKLLLPKSILYEAGFPF